MHKNSYIFIFIAMALIAGVIIILIVNKTDESENAEIPKEPIDLKPVLKPNEITDEHICDGNCEHTPHDSYPISEPLCPILTDNEKIEIQRFFEDAISKQTIKQQQAFKKLQNYGARAIPYLHELVSDEPKSAINENINILMSILENIPAKHEMKLLLPGLEVDLARKFVIAEATVVAHQDDDDIDYVLTSSKNRDKKALLKLVPSASQLHKGLVEIGALASTLRPEFASDFRIFDGSLFKITVEFEYQRTKQEEITKIVRPLEHIIFDRVIEDTMNSTGWVFLGAVMDAQSKNCLTDKTGSIFSLHNEDVFAMFTNPWLSGRDKKRFGAYFERLPKPGKKIQLRFEFFDDEKANSQKAEVIKQYDSFADERENLLLLNKEIKQYKPIATGFQEPVELADFATQTSTTTKPKIGIPLPKLLPEAPENLLVEFKKHLDKFFKCTDDELVQVIAEIKKYDCRFFATARAKALENYYDKRYQKLIETARTISDHSYVENGITYYHGIAIYPEKNLIVADATVSELRDMPLEYLIAGPQGKTYESLFVLEPLGLHLQKGLERIGLKKSSQRTTQRGDWLLYDGDAARIQVCWLEQEVQDLGNGIMDYKNWLEGENVKHRYIEDLVLDLRTGKSIPRGGFPFVGAKFRGQNFFEADEFGTICGAFSDTTTILENPWDGAMIPHVYQTMKGILPKQKSSVRLFFTPESKEAREKRMKLLKPIWEKERLSRPFVYFDAPAGWEASTYSAFRYYRGNDKLIIAPRANPTEGFKITDDDIKSWEDELESNAGFGNWTSRERKKYKDCESYLAILKSKSDEEFEGTYIFIYFIRTLKFDYEIHFSLEKPDLTKAQAMFDALLGKLTVGHKENYPSYKKPK